MHIETIGAGAPLVLIHGWAMHSGVFAPLTERLATRFQVHLVDLPGHGRSREDTRLDPQRILSTLIERIPTGAVWVGWSLGGLIALEAAHRIPEHLRAVAVMASSPRFVDAADWRHGVPGTVFEQFALGLERDFRATVERFLALEAMGSVRATMDMDALRTSAFEHGAPALDSLRQGLDLLQHSDWRIALPTLSRPSLWIAGRRDRLVPPQAMRWAAARAPEARYLELDSGHMPFLSEADAVARALSGLMNVETRNVVE
ncbi:pimeloyl-ACP methyl ester esterase BioH [Xanthomonadaceae bacterium XH05]|nr:pimeloyl-ACP methyl ester esterase BioH [Xanthomonadaceae bacterium XH05]